VAAARQYDADQLPISGNSAAAHPSFRGGLASFGGTTTLTNCTSAATPPRNGAALKIPAHPLPHGYDDQAEPDRVCPAESDQ